MARGCDAIFVRNDVGGLICVVASAHRGEAPERDILTASWVIRETTITSAAASIFQSLVLTTRMINTRCVMIEIHAASLRRERARSSCNWIASAAHEPHPCHGKRLPSLRVIETMLLFRWGGLGAPPGLEWNCVSHAFQAWLIRHAIETLRSIQRFHGKMHFDGCGQLSLFSHLSGDYARYEWAETLGRKHCNPGAGIVSSQNGLSQQTPHDAVPVIGNRQLQTGHTGQRVLQQSREINLFSRDHG